MVKCETRGQHKMKPHHPNTKKTNDGINGPPKGSPRFMLLVSVAQSVRNVRIVHCFGRLADLTLGIELERRESRVNRFLFTN